MFRPGVSGGRSQSREIPGRESSGSWDPDVRRQNERSQGGEDKNVTLGQKMPGSVVTRMELQIISCCSGAAT